MTPSRAHRSARPRLGLALAGLLAACANVLGIEDRKVDSATNYPSEGYEGCRPGDCSRCLDVHQDQCEAADAFSNLLSTCSESNPADCAGCVCRSCEDELLACEGDAGCPSIWQCLRETRCDLSERAAGNCLEVCGTIIQANGGVTGDSFRAAADIRSCAATSACLTCLAPQAQQSARECTQTNGCQDCGACFDRCLCSGDRFSDCQRACAGEDAPPTACSQDDGCAGCTNCFDACTCGDSSFETCVATCTAPGGPDPDPDPPAACNAETSCAGCKDCVSQCTCSGAGTTEACTELCAPPPASDQCSEDPRGSTLACDGCQSCIADCTCKGTAIEHCRGGCQQADCCGMAGGCGTPFTDCLCTSSGAECFAQVHGSCANFGGCDSCACQQCPGELGMCFETPGCQQAFECMRASQCRGSACLERCRASDSTPEAFAYAEALWACYSGNQCSCGFTPPATAECPTLQGSVQCEPYVGNVIIQACCSSAPIEMGAPSSAEQGLLSSPNPCGLQLNAFFRDAQSCEPRTQPNPPRFDMLETCPDRPIFSQPYSGALLQGCCREDNTCGLFDDVTGLGCVSAAAFGAAPMACP